MSKTQETPALSDAIINGIVPQIDWAKVQQRANEFATQGVEAALREYYCGYNSPFMKSVSAYLDANFPFKGMELPNFSEMIVNAITATIQTKVIDKVIAEPVVKALERISRIKDMENDGSIKLSNVFENICNNSDFEGATISLELSDKHSSYSKSYEAHLKIEGCDYERANLEFNFTLFENYDKKSFCISEWGFSHDMDRTTTMKVTTESGIRFEIPTLRSIENPALALLARLVLYGTPIIVDETSFYHDNED